MVVLKKILPVLQKIKPSYSDVDEKIKKLWFLMAGMEKKFKRLSQKIAVFGIG